MDDFTLLTFSGRLTEDPELITASNGNPICKFRVAVNKKIGKDEERTSYIPVTVFGKKAELCAQYLSKGRGVRVVGEFETDEYTDKDGNKRKGFGCVVGMEGVVQFGSGGTKNDDASVPTPRTTAREKTESTIRGKIMDRGGSIRGQTRRR